MNQSLSTLQQWSLYLQAHLNRFPSLQDLTTWQEPYPAGQLYDQVYQAVYAASCDDTLRALLRQNRNYQMCRIALRDLSGLADLEETMRDCSDLADALVAASLDWHYEKLIARFGQPIGEASGQPQKMLVIGMGKLGGQELNFSSDIDLIFVYDEPGETQGGRKSVSNEEFFTRLGRALNKSLVDFTEDGFVYRVDMRLRPFGDSGPLVSSFSGLEHYYELHGRAWERYALVKARVMAGDQALAKGLFEVLRPFVYRRYVDFTAMDSLRDLKQMISAQVVKKGMQNNLKLGPGGIREIEFIVQAFQLIHGGRDPVLQNRQLLPTLNYLLQQLFISHDEFTGLKQAYVFLRRCENRVQIWNDQQVHDLPSDPQQQAYLAQSMGFASYIEFLEVLQVHRTFVEKVFNSLFAEAQHSEQADEMSKVWQADLETLEDLEELDESITQKIPAGERAGFVKLLKDFKQSRSVMHLSVDGIERLNVLMPLLLEALLAKEYSQLALSRVLNILENIVQRSVYLVLLKENKASLKHLVQLAEVSPWLTDMLAKYPALLDLLLDERTLYAPLEKSDLMNEVGKLLHQAGGDEEQFMQEIRQWRHAQVFRVAAADVTGNVPVMHVSDYLTWIAEAVLFAVTEFAWKLLCKKNGIPGGLDLEHSGNPFLILGYGKLGGIELGYGSDLDIVMLYQGVRPSDTATLPEGKKGRPLENSLFFVRMGQKVISLLTTLMPAGIVYEVDTRLRPNGASGLMVTDLPAYKNYIENKAWNWEHQALTRARAVMGGDESKAAFESFRAQFLCQPREPQKVRSEVVEMRQKMQSALDKSDEHYFDLKQGPGGIVDIEFMMQFLVLSYAHQYPKLVEYSDNMRILELVAELGLLSNEQVDQLQAAYQTYRSKYHRVALQNEKPLVETSCYVAERTAVSDIWQQLMMA